MQDPRVVREKAQRLAIRTGWTPDLDFIWQWQRREGFQPCFGSFGRQCRPPCRWWEVCHRLSEEPVDSPTPTLGIEPERRTP